MLLNPATMLVTNSVQPLQSVLGGFQGVAALTVFSPVGALAPVGRKILPPPRLIWSGGGGGGGVMRNCDFRYPPHPQMQGPASRPGTESEPVIEPEPVIGVEMGAGLQEGSKYHLSPIERLAGCWAWAWPRPKIQSIA